MPRRKRTFTRDDIPVINDLERIRDLKDAYVQHYNKKTGAFTYTRYTKRTKLTGRATVRSQFKVEYGTVSSLPIIVQYDKFVSTPGWALRMCTLGLFKKWPEQRDALMFDTLEEAAAAAYEIAQNPNMLATLITDCESGLQKKPHNFDRVDLVEHFTCNLFDFANKFRVYGQDNHVSSSYEPGSSSSSSSSLPPIYLPADIVCHSSSDSEDDASASQPTRVIGRKRHRAPSPPSVSERERPVKRKQLLTSAALQQVVDVCRGLPNSEIVGVQQDPELRVEIIYDGCAYPLILKPSAST
jgi:hypothetical protein